MKRLFAMLVFSTLVTEPVMAQSAGQWHGPEHIWQSSCGYCHGAGIAPELRGKGLEAELTTMVVRQGWPGMPNFHPSEISDRELNDLARWLQRSISPKPEAVK